MAEDSNFALGPARPGSSALDSSSASASASRSPPLAADLAPSTRRGHGPRAEPQARPLPLDPRTLGGYGGRGGPPLSPTLLAPRRPLTRAPSSRPRSARPAEGPTTLSRPADPGERVPALGSGGDNRTVALQPRPPGRSGIGQPPSLRGPQGFRPRIRRTGGAGGGPSWPRGKEKPLLLTLTTANRRNKPPLETSGRHNGLEEDEEPRDDSIPL